MIVSINAPKAVVEEEPIPTDGEEVQDGDADEDASDEDSTEESE